MTLRTTRRGRVALVAVAVAVLGAGGTAVAVLDGPDTPVLAAAPGPSPAPVVRAALLPPLDQDAPVPTAAGLAPAIGVTLADPAVAGRLAVSVVDARTGAVVLERGAGRPLLPASTAKIATAAAALAALDPAARLTTRVLSGAVAGEVVLVGGGDPTLAGTRSPRGYPGLARLTDLADRVRSSLGPVVVTRVLVDESLWSGERLGPGWKPSYVAEGAVAPVGPLMVDGGRVRPDRSRRHADPALAAGQALAGLLGPGAVVARGQAPAGAEELGAVQSPPLSLLVERMLSRSDNDLAEALARAVALAQGQPASFAGAAAAVGAVLAGLGVTGVDLDDGSGLSRSNRLQPAALTRLLARAGSEDRFAPLLAGLPVAGFDGTLARRYRTGPGVPAAGVVRAKTGTLDGVSALAGLVQTADGRLLAFDLTADGVPLGATRGAEAALDRLAAALASCGCR